MNHPHFDFVNDIQRLNYTWLDDIFELFGEWEYSDERLAILRECYEKPKNGVELTDSVIQEWKDWHKEEEEEEEEEHSNYRCNDCDKCGEEFDNEGDMNMRICYECDKPSIQELLVKFDKYVSRICYECDKPNSPPEPDCPPPDSWENKKKSNSTIMYGVVCKKCNATLPPHSCKEHLDINNSIHKCPHIPSGTQCECCDNIAIAYFEDLPACRDCYNNAVAYYKTEFGIDMSLSDDE
jgi:hypothetical protein